MKGHFAAVESICKIRIQAQPKEDDLSGEFWFVRIWTDVSQNPTSIAPRARAIQYLKYLKERPWFDMESVCEGLRDMFPCIAAIEITEANLGIGFVVYTTWP